MNNIISKQQLSHYILTLNVSIKLFYIHDTA